MTSKPETAMILAAGYGRRMHPITTSIPKPLVEVGGRTMIDRVLDRLLEFGIKKVVANVSYKGEMIEKHLKKRNDIEILFSREDTPLETGGGIKKALPLLGDKPFFVCNSDIIWLDGTKPALNRLTKYWDESQMDSLLLLSRTVTSVGYHGSGDFFLGPYYQIRRRGESEIAPYVFAGVQIMHPRLLANYPKEAFALGELLQNSNENDRWIPRMSGLPHDGIWLHVGDPKSIKLAEEELV